MNKRLVIVRHGKSSWAEPGLSDFYRPLKPKGVHDALEVGEALRSNDVALDRIVSSPAIRAVSTAIVIARKMHFPLEKLHLDAGFYEASVYDLVKQIRRTDDAIGTLMIFGHNPSFTELVNQLQSEPLYNLPTCGAYVIDIPIDSWADLGSVAGRTVLSLFPKEMS